ncbi:MAG: hypothetical protein QM765_31345 [Myxococcales bacterium]
MDRPLQGLAVVVALASLLGTGCAEFLVTAVIATAAKTMGERAPASTEPSRPSAPQSIEVCPAKVTRCVAGRVVVSESAKPAPGAACETREAVIEDCGTGFCDPSTFACLEPCAAKPRVGPDFCAADRAGLVRRVWVAEGPTEDDCRLEPRTFLCESGWCDRETSTCRPLPAELLANADGVQVRFRPAGPWEAPRTRMEICSTAGGKPAPIAGVILGEDGVAARFRTGLDGVASFDLEAKPGVAYWVHVHEPFDRALAETRVVAQLPEETE